MDNLPTQSYTSTYFFIIICITFFVLLSSILIAFLPSEQSTATNQDLILAVQQATLNYLGTTPTDGLVITPLAQTKTWAYGTVGIVAPTVADASPWGVLFLAELKLENNTWQVAIEHTPLFYNWLNKAPPQLVAPTTKAFLLDSIYKTQGNNAAQLGLPWAVGETWRLTGGPHHNNGCDSSIPGDCEGNHPWSALDFAGGSGQVRAAREGIVYLDCPNFIRINHGEGWQTGYYHISNIAVENGQFVSRGTLLGQISTEVGCGGYATGPHQHFSLRQNGIKQEINDHTIGGWTVQAGSVQYSGCMQKGGQVECVPNGQLYNDGTVGCVDVVPVGTYSSRRALFVTAYERNNGKTNLGCTENGAHWWDNGAVIQDFTGTPTFGDAIIVQDESHDIPAGTIPAYVVHGNILSKYFETGNSTNYGPPTSDEFINLNGTPQANFSNGYVIWDSNTNEGTFYPWPTTFSTWKAEYYNNTNLVGFPTIIRNEESPNHIWQYNAPEDGHLGVFANQFSVRWSYTETIVVSGTYRFSTLNDDGLKLRVDNNLIINNWQNNTQHNQADITLEAGEHPLIIEYFDEDGPAYLDINWGLVQPSANPTVTIETPLQNKIVEGIITIEGWAIDTSTVSNTTNIRDIANVSDIANISDTGISKIYIYLDGPADGGRALLGEATYHLARPDIAALYGNQFLNSGYSFTWNSNSVLPGPYTLYIYAYSTQASQWIYINQPIQVVDTVPPTQPTNLSPQGWSGFYTTDNTPTFQWQPATDASGLAGYFIALNDWTPDGTGPTDWLIGNVLTWTLTNTLALSDDVYIVALTAIDNIGLVNPTDTNTPGDAPYYQFIVDTIPPSGATNLSINSLLTHGDTDNNGIADSNYITTTTAIFNWTIGEDAGSGIDTQWGSFDDWTPDDDDIFLGNTNTMLPSSGSIPSYIISSTFLLTEGPHFFAITTQDKAGHQDVPTQANTHPEAAPHIHFFIDTIPPTSTISTLPTTLYGLNFTLNWTGTDSPLGSGIAAYDIQVKDGINGLWQNYLTNTHQLSTSFSGQVGHTYHFRSRATDHAGNVEAWPPNNGDTSIYIASDTLHLYMPLIFKNRF